MRRWIRLVVVTLAMAGAAFAGVTVSTPTNGSTTGTPTHFVASASSGNPIAAMRIYVDNNNYYTVSSNKIDTYLSLSAGSHYVVFVAWDSTGASTASPTIQINVTSTSSSSGAQRVLLYSPTDASSWSSAVHFVANANSSAPVTAMRVYSDGNDVYTTSSSSMDTYVNLPAGQHYIVVQAWDSTGRLLQAPGKTINVTTSNASTAPSNATVISKIEEMSGWEHCDTCAGPGGYGATVPHSMTQWLSSPSMDGSSTTFWLGGSTPYSAALWWKQLGANNNVSNFVYDLYFYMTTPNYSQALEFDVNQSVGGKKYIFGTQCNYRGTGQWDVWDGIAQTWRATGIACAVPSAYQWHHLVWEFSRDNSGNAKFIAVTLDGVKSYVNRTYSMGPSGVNEINVAFQMDGDYAEHAYQTWLDQVKLTYW